MSHQVVETKELRAIAALLPDGDDRRWCEKLSRTGSIAVVCVSRLNRCRDSASKPEQPKPKTKKRKANEDLSGQPGEELDNLADQS
jgi:hypothetical protein